MTAATAPVAEPPQQQDRGPAWADAQLAAALLAVDPLGLGGAVLRAGPGPMRDAWLDHMKALLPAGAPLRRVPAGIEDERLFGGLDLAATLKAGRPLASRGVLAESDGGLVILAMAERLGAETAGRFAQVLDRGAVEMEREGFRLEAPARFAVVALDEGAAKEEAAPEGLKDRLAFHLDLNGFSLRDLQDNGMTSGAVAEARARLAACPPEGFEGEAEALEALCGGALAIGIDSLRAPLLALRTARAAAALAGERRIGQEDLALAARLVLAPRARFLPAPPDQQEEEPQPEEPEDKEPQEPENEQDQGDMKLEDLVVEAAIASLPSQLLRELAALGERRRSAPAGRSGAKRRSTQRGRPLGPRPGEPKGGQRLDLLATLRSAAPWQSARRRERERAGGEAAQVIQVRREDFRIKRRQATSRTTTLLVVDASGSSALQRLAEVKGAAEILLQESYVRRDQVALIAFRGEAAELLLPPTRSLARARRELSSLPGGGPTPLASAILSGAQLGESLLARGETPFLVLLTDGRGNIALDGTADRAKAREDALGAARRFRAAGLKGVLIDSGRRPEPKAAELAEAMGARYLHLPRADAGALSREARAAADAAKRSQPTGRGT